jgi:putative autoinducer-2 (AI-2) aldolase
MQCGAIGVDMGRNIWQSEYPAAMIQAVKAIIHKGATVKEALELSESLSTEPNHRKSEFSITEEDIKTSSVH